MKSALKCLQSQMPCTIESTVVVRAQSCCDKGLIQYWATCDKCHIEHACLHPQGGRQGDKRRYVILMGSRLQRRLQRFQRLKVKDAAFLCQHTIGHSRAGSGSIGGCWKRSQPQAIMVNKSWELATETTHWRVPFFSTAVSLSANTAALDMDWDKV